MNFFHKCKPNIVWNWLIGKNLLISPKYSRAIRNARVLQA